MPDQYVTLEDADRWSDARGDMVWAELDDKEKDAALIKASEWIDRLYQFRGLPEDNTQTRAWPRRDAFRDDGRALMGIPVEVSDAVIILAAGFAESDDVADHMLGISSRVRQEKAGRIEVQYEPLPYRYRSKITRVLAPVLAPSMQGQLRRG